MVSFQKGFEPSTDGFCFDLEKNDEKKKKKILIFPGSRLYARKKHVKTKRAHNAEHDEIVTVEEDTNTVVWTSTSEQVQTVRVKLALPSDVLQVQFCRFGLSRTAATLEVALASLCAMHEDGLLVYNPLSGEILDVPRPEGCREMWPCAFGMVFRREHDGKMFLVEHPTGRARTS